MRIGSTIQGKYRLEALLGKGGVGSVYSAEHLVLKRPVAIKLLNANLSGKVAAKRRFEREARAAARLSSQHVAQVLDFGELSDGTPFIVMERLIGKDLACVLQTDGALGVQESLEYMLQVCDALADAHSNGIVHRDIKPGNLFLVRSRAGKPMIKVLDFGISKFVDSEVSVSLTRSSAVVGTPIYMSPEQIEASKHVDARSDIWALGAVLYEMLSGVPVFSGRSLADVTLAVVKKSPPSVDCFADVDAGLRDLIERCMAKKPEGRPQSVPQLAEALGSFVTGAEWRPAVNLTSEPLAEVVSRPQQVSSAAEPGSLRPAAVDTLPDKPQFATGWWRSMAVGALIAAGGFGLTFGLSFLPVPSWLGLKDASPELASPELSAEMVTIRVTTKPVTANLYVGDSYLGRGIISLTTGRESKPMVIRAEHAGYASVVRHISRESDITLALTLRPLGAGESSE